MTSVERAKQFIQEKSSAIAFTVVPLASLIAIATPAKATTVFHTSGNCSISPIDGAATIHTSVSNKSCDVASLTGTLLTGISISGSGDATVTSDTGVQQSNHDFGLEFVASGAITGDDQDLSVKFSWDFGDDLSNGAAGSDGYGLLIMIDGTTLFSKGGSFGSGGAITGSVTKTVPAGSTSYSILLDIEASSDGTNSEIIGNIPAGTSIDVKSQDAPAVPEPSTMSLAASALGGLLWWRHRRKS